MATSEACIHALSKLILSARTLRSLSLEWNSIGFPIALAEAVAQAPGLTSLDLRNCELSSSSVASVLLAAQPGSRLSLLDLRWNVLGSSAGVQFLQAAQTGEMMTSRPGSFVLSLFTTISPSTLSLALCHT